MASKYPIQKEDQDLVSTDKYLDASGHWSVPEGGSSTLADLTDVEIENPTDGQGLVYDAESGTFKNGDVAQPEVFDTDKDGLVPKSVEETNKKYLRDDGLWSDPIEVITPEYYYAHKAEIEASGLTYLVQGTIQGTTDASTVGYDNTGSGLQSTNVQDAIDELANSGSGDDAIFFGIEELMARNTFRTTTTTGWTELSRTSLRSIPPAKAGYTLKFKLCARCGTYESNTCKIAFGNIQMINIGSWSGLSTSYDDYAYTSRSGYYSVSQLTDVAAEDSISTFSGWYRLKFASSVSGKQAYVMSVWLEWYYVKDV